MGQAATTIIPSAKLPEGLPPPAYIKKAFEGLRAREVAWLYSLPEQIKERLGGRDHLHHLTFSGLFGAVLLGVKPCLVMSHGRWGHESPCMGTTFAKKFVGRGKQVMID